METSILASILLILENGKFHNLKLFEAKKHKKKGRPRVRLDPVIFIRKWAKRGGATVRYCGKWYIDRRVI